MERSAIREKCYADRAVPDFASLDPGYVVTTTLRYTGSNARIGGRLPVNFSTSTVVS